jgi:hypothetical protein
MILIRTYKFHGLPPAKLNGAITHAEDDECIAANNTLSQHCGMKEDVG